MMESAEPGRIAKDTLTSPETLLLWTFHCTPKAV
jgi:hypothetical protein